MVESDHCYDGCSQNLFEKMLEMKGNVNMTFFWLMVRNLLNFRKLKTFAGVSWHCISFHGGKIKFFIPQTWNLWCSIPRKVSTLIFQLWKDTTGGTKMSFFSGSLPIAYGKTGDRENCGPFLVAHEIGHLLNAGSWMDSDRLQWLYYSNLFSGHEISRRHNPTFPTPYHAYHLVETNFSTIMQ